MTVTVVTEDNLQATIFQYHWNTFPMERGRLFHINQKARNAIEGNRMKAMGVVPGVSDFCYLVPGGKVFWLELKTETGRQSDEQIKFQKLCESLGHDYRIIRSLEDFKAFHVSL